MDLKGLIEFPVPDRVCAFPHGFAPINIGRVFLAT